MSDPAAGAVYSAEQASIYAKLGIIGTTYGIGYECVGRLLGNLSHKRFLDFGCGAGRSSHFLVGLGAEVIGVDHNTAMLERARIGSLNSTCKFVHVNEQLPFGDSYFDGALSVSAFSELRSIEKMVQICSEIHRVTVPGGRLIIVSTNPSAYSSTFRNFSYWGEPPMKSGQQVRCTITVEGHAFDVMDTYWTRDDYERALKGSGWRLDEVHYPIGLNPGWSADESQIPPFIVLAASK